MAILLRCHSCQKKLQVDDAFAGSLCRCIYCGALSEVPAQAGADDSGRPSRPPGPGSKKSAESGTSSAHLQAARPSGPSGRAAAPPGRPGGPQAARAGRPERVAAPAGGSSATHQRLSRARAESGSEPEVYGDGRVIATTMAAEKSALRGVLTLAFLGVAVLMIFALTFVIVRSARQGGDESAPGGATAGGGAAPAGAAAAGAAGAGAAPAGAAAGQPAPGQAAPPSGAAGGVAVGAPAGGKSTFLDLPLAAGSVIYVVDCSSSLGADNLGMVAKVVRRSVRSLDPSAKVSLLMCTEESPTRWAARVDQPAGPAIADEYLKALVEAPSAGRTDLLKAVDEAIGRKPANVVVITGKSTGESGPLNALREKAAAGGTRVTVLNVDGGDEGPYKPLASSAGQYSGLSGTELVDHAAKDD